MKSKDDYVERDRTGKEEKRETSERKSRDKRSKEEKLYDDRKVRSAFKIIILCHD